MKNTIQRTLVIVGPTASGKSDLAITLARQYNGEVISADSRQVYRGMDIGSGKVTRDSISCHPEPVERSRKNKNGIIKSEIPRQARNDNYFYSEGIVHHLLDIASPKRNYNVTHFVRDAKRIITDIKKRGKASIICGGTGFWIQTIIEDSTFPAVKPDIKLRKRLDKLSTEKLFTMLEKKDPRRAKTIDKHNKVRLIRALEIIATLGKVPRTANNQRLTANEKNYIIIALNPDKEILRKNIKVRLKKRLGRGMLAEVKDLHTDGVSWKRLESFGLEYKNVALFLQKKITREMMQQSILQESIHYAKRQLTFLRHLEKMGAHIHWISDPKEAKNVIGK